jgi:two-component system, response regulator / RNA-binding antiterminator
MTSPAAPTRVVIVSTQPLIGGGTKARVATLRQGLEAAGCIVTAVLQAAALLAEQLTQLQPELVVVDAQDHAHDTLQQLLAAMHTGLPGSRLPIVLFTADTNTQQVQTAIAAGVVAYEIGDLTAERVAPVLAVAWARFAYQEQLLAQLDEARAQLADRKCIDKAKALLMQRHQIGEPEAYARLRKAAMDKGQKMAEVAQRLVDAADLLM